MVDSPRVEPLDVAVHLAERQLRITWSDQHAAVYDFEYLRWRCPCATCSGEGNAPGLLSRLDHLQPQQTDLVDLHVVGRYGLTPVWADGHQTGIYTYRALRDLCQCAACASASAAGEGTARS